MKKLFLTLAILTASLVGFSQKRYYVVDAQMTSGSTKYTRVVADSIVVDSIQVTYNCYFGQVGNTYIVKTSYGWAFCAFVQITKTIAGNPREQYLLNVGKRFADAYRQQNYPNVP